MQGHECTSARQWLERSKAVNQTFMVAVSVVEQEHKQAWNAAAVSVQCTDLMKARAAS